MKEKIEEISLSMERGHRRILRVLSALAVISLFAALWKWRGLAAMEPIVEGGQRRWLLAIGASIAVSLAAQWVLYLLPWPLLALFGRMTPFCSIFARRPCVGSNAELSRAGRAENARVQPGRNDHRGRSGARAGRIFLHRAECRHGRLPPNGRNDEEGVIRCNSS